MKLNLYFIALFIILSTACQNEKQHEKKIIKIIEIDTVLTSSNNLDSSEIDYSELLKGKFILKGASYAGFDFISDKKISWTNELFPHDPDFFRLRWLNETTFFASKINETNTNCPPLVWIYKVESFDGTKLVMTDVSTSWNDLKDDQQIFIKE